jgi:hypothetical protein
MMKKQYSDAYREIDEAIAKEPDAEDAYWTVVTVSTYDKNYTKTVAWLQKIESQFGYDFAEENFADQDAYKDFILSQEFTKWMKSKN